MTKMVQNNQTFRNVPYARYATDVTFQQSNRPAGNHEEALSCFFKTHKLYGYKVEVSVLPNGLALGAIKHFRGKLQDIDIIRENIVFHDAQLKRMMRKEVLLNLLHSHGFGLCWLTKSFKV